MWLNLQLQLYTFTSPPLSLSHCPAHSTTWPTNSFSSSPAPACAMEHHGEGAFSQDMRWQNIPPCLGMLFHYSIIHTVKSKGWVLQFHWPTQWCNPNFDLLGDWKALATCRGLLSCLFTTPFPLPILPRIATRTHQANTTCLPPVN